MYLYTRLVKTSKAREPKLYVVQKQRHPWRGVFLFLSGWRWFLGWGRGGCRKRNKKRKRVGGGGERKIGTPALLARRFSFLSITINYILKLTLPGHSHKYPPERGRRRQPRCCFGDRGCWYSHRLPKYQGFWFVVSTGQWLRVR